MSEKDRWNWLSKNIPVAVVGAVVGALLDFFLNNSGILSFLSGILKSLLFASVQVWEVLLTLAIISILGLMARWYLGTDHRTDHVLGIDWISEWEGREPLYLEPICPECGIEMDITSKLLDSQHTSQYGGRGIKSYVCASTSCSECNFEMEWEDVTGVEYHTVSSSERINLKESLQEVAKKRINARRRQW